MCGYGYGLLAVRYAVYVCMSVPSKKRNLPISITPHPQPHSTLLPLIDTTQKKKNAHILSKSMYVYIPLFSPRHLILPLG